MPRRFSPSKRVELWYNETMKILYVCTSTDTGGAEKALFALARAAKEASHEIKIISLFPLGSVGKDMLEQGWDVISLDLRGKIRPLETAGVLARLIREIQTFGPDVVHASLFRAIILCRLAKKKISFRFITTPHYDLSKKNYFLKLLDRALKDQDDLSCAESQSTADFLVKKQKYKEEKVRLVSNGVDGVFFHPNNALRLRMRQELGFSEYNIVFACVARLSKEKNHGTLLESFASLWNKNPGVRLLLVGDGPEKEKLQNLCRQKGIEKEVLFAGEVRNVYPYLLACDVFILLSYIESLPLSLLEACSCGKASIVSKSGDMPRVVLHGKSGFVCNGQDRIVVSALMAELAENQALRTQMGKEARLRMEKYYPSSEYRYLQIYKEMI